MAFAKAQPPRTSLRYHADGAPLSPARSGSTSALRSPAPPHPGAQYSPRTGRKLPHAPGSGLFLYGSPRSRRHDAGASPGASSPLSRGSPHAGAATGAARAGISFAGHSNGHRVASSGNRENAVARDLGGYGLGGSSLGGSIRHSPAAAGTDNFATDLAGIGRSLSGSERALSLMLERALIKIATLESQLETAQRLYGFDPAAAAAGTGSVASPLASSVPGTPTPRLQAPPGAVERRARGAAGGTPPPAPAAASTGARVATHRRMGELLASATASGLGAAPASPSFRAGASAGAASGGSHGGAPASPASAPGGSGPASSPDDTTVSVASYRKVKDRASALQKRCHRFEMALEQLLRSCGMPAGRSSGTGNGDGSSVVDALTVIPTTVIELRAAVDKERRAKDAALARAASAEARADQLERAANSAKQSLAEADARFEAEMSRFLTAQKQHSANMRSLKMSRESAAEAAYKGELEKARAALNQLHERKNQDAVEAQRRIMALEQQLHASKLGADASAVEIQQLKDQVESLRSLQDTATAAEREAAKETQKNALMAAHITRLEEQGRRERQLLQSQVRHLTSEVARLQAVNRSLKGRFAGYNSETASVSGRSVSSMSRASTSPRPDRAYIRRPSRHMSFHQSRRESRLLALSRLQGNIGNEYTRHVAALHLQHWWRNLSTRQGGLVGGARMREAAGKVSRLWKRYKAKKSNKSRTAAAHMSTRRVRQSTYSTPTDANLASLFHAIDGKGQGFITVDDFESALRKMGRASLSSHKAQELLRLFTNLRGRTRGRITRAEFVEGMRGTKNTGFCRWMEGVLTSRVKHVDGGQLSAEEAARLRQDKLERLEYVYSLADEDGDGGLTLTEFLATVRRARGTTLAKDLRLQLQMYSMIEKAPDGSVSREGWLQGLVDYDDGAFLEWLDATSAAVRDKPSSGGGAGSKSRSPSPPQAAAVPASPPPPPTRPAAAPAPPPHQRAPSTSSRGRGRGGRASRGARGGRTSRGARGGGTSRGGGARGRGQ